MEANGATSIEDGHGSAPADVVSASWLLGPVADLLQAKADLADLALGVLAAFAHDQERLPLGLVVPAESGKAPTPPLTGTQHLQDLPARIAELAAHTLSHGRLAISPSIVRCRDGRSCLSQERQAARHCTAGERNTRKNAKLKN